MLAGATIVEAEPDDIRQVAREHFDAGQQHYAAGRYSEAIGEFEAAYRLAPLPDLLFNIGQCHRQSGDPVLAIDYYKRYLAVAPEGTFAKVAGDHLTALEATVAESRRKAEEAARLEAERKAEEARRERERVAATVEADRLARELAKLEEERQAKLVAQAQKQAPSVKEKIVRETPLPRLSLQPERSTGLIVGTVLVGIGVVTGVVVGGTLYASAKADNVGFRFGPSACAPNCRRESVDDAKRREQTGYVLMAVSGALLATEIVLWSVLGRHRERVGMIRVAPTVFGFVAGGTF
mgnify:FL=1